MVRSLAGRIGRQVLGPAVLVVLLVPSPAPASEGGYQVDFRAADPAGYEAVASSTCPAGRAADPLAGAQFATGVTSLESGVLVLGQIVAFQFQISVDPAAVTDGSTQFNAGWGTQTTSGADFGYADILCAFVDSSDPSASETDQDATASFAKATSDTQITGIFAVSGLDPGEQVVVEVWILLDAAIPPGAAGNVQAELPGPGGSQVIPLLNVEDLQAPGTIIAEKFIADGSDQSATFSFSGALQSTLGHTQRAQLEVRPGTYQVSETVPAGWKQPSIACSDSDSSGSGATATFVVEAGEAVTCRFTNSQVPTISVTVEKTNDASGDGIFGDEETLVVDPATPGLRGPVTFRAVIVNTSPVDVVIVALTDTFGSTSIDVCPDLVGTVLASGASITCQFTLSDYAPSSGAFQVNSAAVQVAQVGDPANTASHADDSKVNFVKVLPQAQLNLSVQKLNDANRDGAFSDRETLAGLRGEVAFRAVLTNQSAVDLVLTGISDTFGTRRMAVCAEMLRMVLRAGASATCRFTLQDYAPSSGSSQVNTVLVDAEELRNPSNTTFAQDTSRVDFAEVVSATTTSTIALQVLPFTGPQAGTGLGAILLLVGLVVLALAHAKGRDIRSTDWISRV